MRQPVLVCETCNSPFSSSPPPQRRAKLDESFLVLPRSQQQQLLLNANATSGANALAHVHEQVQHAAGLMDLARSTVEEACAVALCADCASFVLRDLEGRTLEIAQQNQAIQSVLQQERRRAAGETRSQAILERENSRVAKEEAIAERELAELVRQQREVREQRAALDLEEAALNAQVELHWREWNLAQLEAAERADVELHHSQLLAHCNHELRRLKGTSVLDDVFDIWFDGPFGTLNGLRLGRLPAVLVDWAEINAALGHAALLVDTLSTAHHLRFPKHTLHLMGSFSKIAHNDEPKVLLELHGSGNLQLGHIFSGTRFDRALSMFLQCVGALLAHARRSTSPSLGDAPYRIEDDKIGTADSMLSIRLQFNQDELWTRALKYMLTDLKWLLAWHTQVSAAALKQGKGAQPASGTAGGAR